MGQRAIDGTILDGCLQRLKPGEPFFVLRAFDVLAAPLVRLWADLAVRVPPEKRQNARVWAMEVGALDQRYPARVVIASAAALLAHIAPGEPFFVLRGQDKLASILVRTWAALAFQDGLQLEEYDHAMRVAGEMDRWSPRKFPD